MGWNILARGAGKARYEGEAKNTKARCPVRFRRKKETFMTNAAICGVSIEPRHAYAEGIFQPATDAPPVTRLTPAVGNRFTMQLSLNGVVQGYMGINSSSYAVLNTSSGVALELYPYNGKTYIKIPGQNLYLSVSANAYVGFYGWNNASAFVLVNGVLQSEYNGQCLSMYSPENAYLYCWDKYSILGVTFLDA